MSYNKEIYSAAKDELSRRKHHALASAEKRHKELSASAPALKKLEDSIAQAGIEVSRVLLDGVNVQDKIKIIAQKNLALQKQRAELLVSLGYTEDYLEPQYTCKLCSDEGFINGRICECHKRLLKEIACRQLSAVSPLEISTFESFKLEYYPSSVEAESGISPRHKMEEIFMYCKKYAYDFSEFSPSLFLYGPTGLGKTHLSLAVAGEAINHGFGVVYASAQNLLNKMQNEYFGRASDIRGTTEQLVLDCDLLILDDLGAEFSSTYTVSAVYNIINSRLLTGRPVIISTNLTLRELEEKYSQRITSRIIGNYVSLRFFGRDVRQIKRSIGK